MRISLEIMAKVTDKEKENKDLSRCIEVRICPKCGEDLKITEIHGDGGASYSCSSCEFIHEN